LCDFIEYVEVGKPPKITDRKDEKIMKQDQIRSSVNLLTEVACCTFDIHGEATESFQICEKAVGYLAKDAPELLKHFKTEAEKVKSLKGADAYNTNDYPEKADDIRMTIALLDNLAKEPDAPAETLNGATEMLTDFYDVEIRGSIQLITEQACCLLQAHGKEPKGKAGEDLEICKQAMDFLTKGDPELMQNFTDRMDAVKHDPEADYNTEQYDGKKADIRNAVAQLVNHAKDPETPAEQGEILNQAAEMIAVFYGMNDALPNAA